MTPQTPRAALSDADIRDLVKECGLDWHRGFVPLFDGDPTNRYAVLVRAAIDADRRLTAEQGGAEPPKPFCHVVNMLEGLPENPSYIMLFDGQRFGNGFTHTALYTGEQLVAALTTQPQEPATPRYKAQPPDYKVQPGTWELRAPDGTSWHESSPMKCLQAEQHDRIPASVAIARIFTAVDEDATQPQAEPAAKVYATDDMRRAAEMEFAYSGRHIGQEEAAALATPTAPTEPT